MRFTVYVRRRKGAEWSVWTSVNSKPLALLHMQKIKALGWEARCDGLEGVSARVQCKRSRRENRCGNKL